MWNFPKSANIIEAPTSYQRQKRGRRGVGGGRRKEDGGRRKEVKGYATTSI